MTEPILWWMSWNDRTENNPRRGIPVPGVVGWWVTGWAADNSYRCIVALVCAPTKRAAAQILGTNWPSYGGQRDWRFARRLEVEWLDMDVVPRVGVISLGDRFPLARWSIERLRSVGLHAKVTP